ncbi:hypothetical protein TorRG33x02_264560 [Trema orientale]|uniref:Uncharacterized protein n=1 Tax=Trema orientale TaxID=63057 RepID=A0A2P5D2G8_TREOI|nr:hypothetical protein TorRG33x02_264560 [Trema orientale]
MAGLQYNFFPTDFLYPRPADSAAPKSVAPLQIRRRDDIADDALLLERRQSKPLNDISLRRPAKAAAPLLKLKLKPQQKERGGSANSLPLLVWFPAEQSNDSS